MTCGLCSVSLKNLNFLLWGELHNIIIGLNISTFFFHFGMVFVLLSIKALKHLNADSLKVQWVTSVDTVSL